MEPWEPPGRKNYLGCGGMGGARRVKKISGTPAHLHRATQTYLGPGEKPGDSREGPRLQSQSPLESFLRSPPPVTCQTSGSSQFIHMYSLTTCDVA